MLRDFTYGETKMVMNLPARTVSFPPAGRTQGRRSEGWTEENIKPIIHLDT